MRVAESYILMGLVLMSAASAEVSTSQSGRRVFGQRHGLTNSRRSATNPSRSHRYPLHPQAGVSTQSTRAEASMLQPNPTEPSLPDYAWTEQVMQEDSVRDDASSGMDRQSHSGPQVPLHQTVADSGIEADKIWSRHSLTETSGRNAHDPVVPTPADPLGVDASSHSPVVYRYFGRARSRLHTADSIPFIVLGPCVEHWKTIGEALASRGFNVMACELVDDKDGDRRDGQQGKPDEGKNLILAVLDALRWTKAIIVGCDGEAAMAIEAAIQLGPDRVAGLVLCGDLKAVEDKAKSAIAADMDARPAKTQRPGALDTYLLERLECPYTVVWDGDEAHRPSVRVETKLDGQAKGDMFAFNRCLILGGGSAPHRRLPEQFAWALTRFVEEKIVPLMAPLPNLSQGDPSPESIRARRNRYPRGLDELFAPGGLLVAGRVVATALLYATAMKVALYQYENIKGGVVSIQLVIQWLSSGRQKVLQSAAGFVRNYGYVFHLLGRLWLPNRGQTSATATERGSKLTQDEVSSPQDETMDGFADDSLPDNSGDDPPEEHNDPSQDTQGFRRLYLLDSVIV